MAGMSTPLLALAPLHGGWSTIAFLVLFWLALISLPTGAAIFAAIKIYRKRGKMG
jgi:hypothetical protein